MRLVGSGKDEALPVSYAVGRFQFCIQSRVLQSSGIRCLLRDRSHLLVLISPGRQTAADAQPAEVRGGRAGRRPLTRTRRSPATELSGLSPGRRPSQRTAPRAAGRPPGPRCVAAGPPSLRGPPGPAFHTRAETRDGSGDGPAAAGPVPPCGAGCPSPGVVRGPAARPPSRGEPGPVPTAATDSDHGAPVPAAARSAPVPSAHWAHALRRPPGRPPGPMRDSARPESPECHAAFWSRGDHVITCSASEVGTAGGGGGGS